VSAILVCNTFADYRDLTCWVFNRHEFGIQNVSATLKSAKVQTSSRYNGYISFSNASGARQVTPRRGQAVLTATITAEGAVVRLQREGPVYLSVFTPSGRTVFSGRRPTSDRRCAFRFGSRRLSACGVYVVSVETADVRIRFLITASEFTKHGGMTYRSYGQAGEKVRSTALGAATTATVDTLILRKFACETLVIPLDRYDTTLEVIMLYNPDIPAAPAGMKAVAGNTFWMGSLDGQANERPVHRVNVSPIYMDSTEVTQKSYAELTGKSPWTDYSGAEPNGVGENLAAWHLNWYDAVYYCNERSKRDNLDTVYSWSSISGPPAEGCTLSNVVTHYEKNGYRLPTEAEWEYAAKAGTRTDYYWGDSRDVDTAGLYAWYRENSDNTLHPVGSLLPNDFELFDICGGLSEWTNDWYRSYDPSGDEETNPTGPAEGSEKVIKDGGIRQSASHMRPAFRGGAWPHQRLDINGQAGFRCVRKAP